jgi:hypothetical protein
MPTVPTFPQLRVRKRSFRPEVTADDRQACQLRAKSGGHWRGTRGQTADQEALGPPHRCSTMQPPVRSPRASQAEGSGPVIACWPSWLALADSTGSVVDAGGGTARHTRAWSAGAPAVVAGCRRLRFVPQLCQMQGATAVNTGVPRSGSRPLPRPVKPQLRPEITQPLS